MVAWSWGMEALMFGSLTMLASGVFARSPSDDSASGMRWASVSRSGNVAISRPESEMSRVSIATPALLAKACTIGRRE